MSVRTKRLVATIVGLWAVFTAAVSIATPAPAANSPEPYALIEAPAAGSVRAGLVTVKAPGHPPIRLYAEETGRGAPLVMLHGFGASGYTFRRIVPALARRYRVITLDLKGHGRSDKPFDHNYSPHDHAVLVYWFLRAYGLNQVTMVGHSYGGQVALNLALLIKRYDPGRIRRLVLMNAPVYPQPFTSAVRLLRKPLLPYVALTLIPRELPIAVALMTEAVGLGQTVTRQDIDVYSQPYADAGARHAIIQTARQIVPDNAAALIQRYPAMTKPALIIWCRDDSAVPLANGQRLARALPRARLKVLSGCEHIPPEQRPRAVVRAIRSFVR